MTLTKIGFARSKAAQLAALLAVPLSLASICVSGSAAAATLTGPISGWQEGGEPSWVSMYEYVPPNVADNAPLFVLLHYCGGNAGAVLGQAEGGGIVAIADQYGFPILVPQTTKNCWDIATTPNLTHGGGGESGAIVSMVKHSVAQHGLNAERVYVGGTSSGAMMTEGLLAVYPDVFKGGTEFAGVPAGCWAVNNMTDGQWSGPCAGGNVTHTPAEWRTIVENMYPGYNGFRPRVQLWHGEADSTISYVNQTEAIKQWTAVHGVSETPTTTTMLEVKGAQYKREEWQDSCGSVVLDAWTQLGGPHGTNANLNAEHTMPFLALDQTVAVNPQVAKCGGTGGSGGTGPGGGSAGGNASGGGGSANAGGAALGGSPTGSGGSGGATSGPAAGGSVGNPGPSNGGNPSVPGPAATTPSRPGMSCDLAGSRAGTSFACSAMLAALLLIGGRRRVKRATCSS